MAENQNIHSADQPKNDNFTHNLNLPSRADKFQKTLPNCGKKQGKKSSDILVNIPKFIATEQEQTTDKHLP